MLRNMNMKLMVAAASLALGVAGCLGGSSGSNTTGGSTGSSSDPTNGSLGIDAARGLLTRMGYNSGARDAELARKVRPDSTITEMFAVGPQLHMLEDITAVEPVRLEIDVEKGECYGEFLWKNCAEDEEHIRIYGIGAEPVCWTQPAGNPPSKIAILTKS